MDEQGTVVRILWRCVAVFTAALWMTLHTYTLLTDGPQLELIHHPSSPESLVLKSFASPWLFPLILCGLTLLLVGVAWLRARIMPPLQPHEQVRQHLANTAHYATVILPRLSGGPVKAAP